MDDRQRRLDARLCAAASFGQMEDVERLIQEGANVNGAVGDHPLLDAAEMGRADVVKLLLQKKANPNVQDEYGFTPLMRYLTNNIAYEHKVLMLLLKAGADVKVQSYNKKDTALHGAVRFGRIDAILPLLQKGADMKALNSDSESALQAARKYKQHEMVAIMEQFELDSLNNKNNNLDINTL